MRESTILPETNLLESSTVEVSGHQIRSHEMSAPVRRLALALTSGLAAIFAAALSVIMVTTVSSGPPLEIAGFLGHYFGTQVTEQPTAEKEESKLWWNDGFWWGNLYSPSSQEYHIYRLDWATQDWVDTGVAVDDRDDSRADVMWDDSNQKLYIVSHLQQLNPGPSNNISSWSRLYRYSYDSASDTYSLDSGYPEPTVNVDKTQTLVMSKDSAGRLWVTYVSKPGTGSSEYFVYVNATDEDDRDWLTPVILPLPEGEVGSDDHASVVAFSDDDGPKIGVMWSDQLSGQFYFATHPDSAEMDEEWTLEALDVPWPSNDHISMKTTSQGQVLAAIKTGEIVSGTAQIALVARDSDGDFSYHEVTTPGELDTNATLVIDEGTNEAYIFMTSDIGGGAICFNEASLTTPLSDMDFNVENCPSFGPLGAEIFIGDCNAYDSIDNPTSTKQIVNATTGLVVLASDLGDDVYVHNYLGSGEPNPICPEPTAGPTPTPTVTATPPPTATPEPPATSTPVPPGAERLIYLPMIKR